MNHCANAYFVCIVLGHKSVNFSSETISILIGKFKRIMFIHPVKRGFIQSELNFSCKVFVFDWLYQLLASFQRKEGTFNRIRSVNEIIGT